MGRPLCLDSDKAVARVVHIGHSLYATLPRNIARIAGIKAGDRLAVETDGRSVLLAKIPFEDLINRALMRAHLDRMDSGENKSGQSKRNEVLP